MVAAINSCSSPAGFQADQGVVVSPSTKTQVKNIQQVAPENQQGSDPALMAVYSHPPVVTVGDTNSVLHPGFADQVTDDDSQFVSLDHAETDYETAPSDMELDPEDNPLPPPLGRPGDSPVAAAAAPQGALELMSAQAVREQPGKWFKSVLSEHVPDHLKHRIWANKYINFQYLIEADPTEEVAYQFVPNNTSDSGLTLQPVKPKAKLDGWVAWNKAMHICLLKFTAWSTLTTAWNCFNM